MKHDLDPCNLPACEICNFPQTGLNSVLGVGICDSCVEDGPDRRLEKLRKLGKLQWSSGVRSFREGYDSRRNWVEGRGELKGRRDSGVRAVFSREREGLGEKLGKLFGKQPALKDMQTGDADFDRTVLITTEDEETTRRFLEAAGARAAIAAIAEGRGAVTVDGATLDVAMAKSWAATSPAARDWETRGLWAIGVLFSEMARFAGVHRPPPPVEDPNPYWYMRRAERLGWLTEYAQRLGGRLDEKEAELLSLRKLRGREGTITLDKGNAAISLRVAFAGTATPLCFTYDPGQRPDVRNGLAVKLGPALYAEAYEGDAAATEAILNALGPALTESLVDLIRRHRCYVLQIGRFSLYVSELLDTAPELDPADVSRALVELFELAERIEASPLVTGSAAR